MAADCISYQSTYPILISLPNGDFVIINENMIGYGNVISNQGRNPFSPLLVLLPTILSWSGGSCRLAILSH